MLKLTRRQLLKTAAISTALSALPSQVQGAERRPLPIPPLIDTRRGRPVVLNMQPTKFALDGKHRVEVWGFNGNYLGATIKVKSGSFAKLNYYNNLMQSVAIGFQGLQASGELFSGTAHSLKREQRWSPIIPIEQPAATCWYHATTLANSAYQTYRGLVGMWIVEDENSHKSSLPQKYGVNDIPVILQDMAFNGEGQQLFKQNQPHFLGDRLLVNGQESPYLDVARGWVRLRLLNASVSRAYDLQFHDQREFLLIAGDLGFLPEAVPSRRLHLAPGERAEILVDLNEGGNATLISGEPRHFLSSLKTWLASNELADNTVLELRPQGEFSAFNQPPALQFNTAGAIENLNQNVSQQRRFHLDSDKGLINQKAFDPRRIDVMAKLHSVERWILTSSSPVGFCIKGAKFLVEKQKHSLHSGWKDTVWIDGETHILVKFAHPSSTNFPFSFGSSNLMLADMGCMGLFVVQ